MSFTIRPTKFEIEHAPAIFAGQAYAATHDGLLPSTPTWRRLEHRYDLAPMRFQRHHPNLARMFERAKVTCLSFPISIPQEQRPEVQSQPLTAASVTPEPASLVLSGVAIVAAWVYRRATR